MCGISADGWPSATCAHSAPDDVVVVGGVVDDLLYFGSVGVHDADVFGRAVVECAAEDDSAAVG